LRIGRSCTWTIGAGKTKDDNAYVITVEACKSEKNELPIVVFDANEPPRSGNIEINYKPRSPVNFEAGGRIYLEAFLCRPKAGLYRISNEVVWPGAAGKND
jgi:hypothetical protein